MRKTNIVSFLAFFSHFLLVYGNHIQLLSGVSDRDWAEPDNPAVDFETSLGHEDPQSWSGHSLFGKKTSIRTNISQLTDFSSAWDEEWTSLQVNRNWEGICILFREPTPSSQAHFLPALGPTKNF